MFDDIDPRSPVPIYAQLATRVRLAVAGGDLTFGEPLPSVRSLASRLRINPATVVQAYRELEREGVVEMRQGAGTFIAGLAAEQSQGVRRAEAKRLVRSMIEQAARAGITLEELRAAMDFELRGT